jgi:hypothetical protein
MVGFMQIAGNNLLLAAQASLQAQKARPAVAPQAAGPSQFEPLSFAKAASPDAPKPQAAAEPEQIRRPGSQLDIRV